VNKQVSRLISLALVGQEDHDHLSVRDGGLLSKMAQMLAKVFDCL